MDTRLFTNAGFSGYLNGVGFAPIASGVQGLPPYCAGSIFNSYPGGTVRRIEYRTPFAYEEVTLDFQIDSLVMTVVGEHLSLYITVGGSVAAQTTIPDGSTGLHQVSFFSTTGLPQGTLVGAALAGFDTSGGVVSGTWLANFTR